MAKITRVGIYARVSTKDKGQEVENQLVQLRRYAEAQDWVIREFVDHETGKHAHRAAFKQLFEAASRREISVALVWSLDRFTREGVGETFAHIKILTQYGCQFESLTEPHFRTTGPAGELMIAVAAWIAKQERLRISERTRAGLEVAKAQGTTLGRRIVVFKRDEARELRRQGLLWREISARMKVSMTTIRRAIDPAYTTGRSRGRPLNYSPSKHVIATKVSRPTK